MKPMPFGRAGTSEEIGVMVAFLASDRSAYTTGTIITIDGGAANRGPMFLGRRRSWTVKLRSGSYTKRPLR